MRHAIRLLSLALVLMVLPAMPSPAAPAGGGCPHEQAAGSGCDLPAMPAPCPDPAACPAMAGCAAAVPATAPAATAALAVRALRVRRAVPGAMPGAPLAGPDPALPPPRQ